MSDLDQNLKSEFQDSEYRYAYSESFLNTKLATQIKTLREQRKETQVAVAARMGIKQPGYRRFEDVNHSVWRTDTLWAVAKALGVRLNISFETFGSLLDDKKHFTKEELERPEFKDDPAFREAEKPEAEDIAAMAPAVNAPMVPARRLGDLMSAVVQNNEELRKAFSMDLSPILAALESQEASWRTVLTATETFAPVNTWLGQLPGNEWILQGNEWAQFADAFASPPSIASIHNPYPEMKEGTMAATSYTPASNEAVDSAVDGLREITAAHSPVICINEYKAKKHPHSKRYPLVRGAGRRKHG